MQQWADAAKEYPEWWTQSQGDDLLVRRVKMRLRNEYNQLQKDKGKKRDVNVQQPFTDTSSWLDHYDPSGTFCSPEGASNSLPGSSLESSENNFLNISNPNLYPPSSATSRQIWDSGLGERSSTIQGLLGTASILDTGQETSSAANTSITYPNLGYQPDVWTAYEPPQSAFAFEQVWAEEGDATQLARPQQEVMPQTSNVSHDVLNLDDPFWNTLLESSSNAVLENSTDIGQASKNNPAHSL